jgi:hypothetical protein
MFCLVMFILLGILFVNTLFVNIGNKIYFRIVKYSGDPNT